MISTEKEEVELIKPICPNKGPLRGCVEKWLLLLENTMCDTIRDITREAVIDYAKNVSDVSCRKPGAREEFALRWPGMIVLSVTQIFWTQDVTRAIKSGGAKAVEEYLCQKTCCRPVSFSAAENTMSLTTMEREAAELAYGQRIAKLQLRGLKAG